MGDLNGMAVCGSGADGAGGAAALATCCDVGPPSSPAALVVLAAEAEASGKGATDSGAVVAPGAGTAVGAAVAEATTASKGSGGR